MLILVLMLCRPQNMEGRQGRCHEPTKEVQNLLLSVFCLMVCNYSKHGLFFFFVIVPFPKNRNAKLIPFNQYI
jgi:hypothetical protein